MKKEIALLLRKFLLGKSSPEEDRQLDRWYGKPSQTRIRLSDAEWQEIKDRIWNSIAARTYKPVTRPLYIRKMRLFAAAAAVAVLLLASGRLLWQEGISGNPQSEMVASVQVTETTATGEIKQIRLPDGTSVWLNNRSSLGYNEHFGEKTREVTLEGEAFFDVTRDTERPFTVHTGLTKTQVLGTSFNVKSYPGGVQQITVATGSVGVEILAVENRQYCQLRPCSRLEFDPATKTLSRRQVNIENLPAWKDGKLVFDRQPLREVTKTLERKYGVSIRIPLEETASRLFSGTFAAGKDLSHILWAVEYSMDVRIERPAENEIIITNNKY